MTNIPYQFLKQRQTRFAAGIMAGGDDTGIPNSPQPVWFRMAVSSASTVELHVPANTVILGHMIEPGNVNAGATVGIGKLGSLATYLAALTPLDAYLQGWLAVPKLHSASDEEVLITPASWTSGTAYVNIMCRLPVGRA